MACWIVGRGLSCTPSPPSRLPPGSQRASPVPATNASFAARPSRHVVSCMFMAAASVSLAASLSMRSCSTTPARSWPRACRWRVPINMAPLILSSTAVALCSFEGSITCPQGPRWPAVPLPSVQPKQAGVVDRRHGGTRIGLDGGQARAEGSHGPPARVSWTARRGSRPSTDRSHCLSPRRRIPEVQRRIVKRTGEGRVSAVGPPSRRVRQRDFVQAR